jgi:hypothetical protein
MDERNPRPHEMCMVATAAGKRNAAGSRVVLS